MRSLLPRQNPCPHIYRRRLPLSQMAGQHKTARRRSDETHHMMDDKSHAACFCGLLALLLPPPPFSSGARCPSGEPGVCLHVFLEAPTLRNNTGTRVSRMNALRRTRPHLEIPSVPAYPAGHDGSIRRLGGQTMRNAGEATHEDPLRIEQRLRHHGGRS